MTLNDLERQNRGFCGLFLAILGCNASTISSMFKGLAMRAVLGKKWLEKWQFLKIGAYPLPQACMVYIPIKLSIVQLGYNVMFTFLQHLIVLIMQVKVHLRWRLKLMVMISLSIYMMTSQNHTCVQCVTNGLHWKEIWINTNKYMIGLLEKKCIIVLSVRNVSLLRNA